MPTSPRPRSPCRTLSSSTKATSAPFAPGCSSPPQARARRDRSTATPGPSPRCWTPPWKARSSCAPAAHELPDLVAALHPGSIEVELVGRVDSVNGGIRTTFENVPDAPVTKFVFEMQGGKKGLLENRTNICKATNRATVLFDGQNGKVHDTRPALRADCPKKAPKKKGKGKGA